MSFAVFRGNKINFMKIKTQYYEAHEAPPTMEDMDRSDDVLIDEAGTRQSFTIGHFCHDTLRWLDDDFNVVDTTPAFRWCWLDLAKYELNPDLCPPDVILMPDLKPE